MRFPQRLILNVVSFPELLHTVASMLFKEHRCVQSVCGVRTCVSWQECCDELLISREENVFYSIFYHHVHDPTASSIFLLSFTMFPECFRTLAECCFSDNICSCIASTCLLLSSFEATVELCSRFYFQSLHVGYLPLPLVRLSPADAFLVVPIDIVFSSNYRNSFSINSFIA